MIGREFSKISPKVWRSNKFRALPSDDERFLLLFLMTCPHQTSAGSFKMPDEYGAADMNWMVDRFREARANLVEAELIAYDPATEEYFVRGWFKFNKPMNASHQKAMVRIVGEVDSDHVREVAETELQPVLIPSIVAQIEPSRTSLTDTAYLNRRAG